ncbi:hypothetical protein GQ54DRAFT_300839, partial [Martensiomyces pterosporus]
MRRGCLLQQHSSLKHRSNQHRRAPCPRIPTAGMPTRKPGEHQRVAAQPTLNSVG